MCTKKNYAGKREDGRPCEACKSGIFLKKLPILNRATSMKMTNPSRFPVLFDDERSSAVYSLRTVPIIAATHRKLLDYNLHFEIVGR